MLPVQEMWSKLDATAQPLLNINEVEGIFEIVDFAILPLQSRAVALKTMRDCSALCTIRCLNRLMRQNQ